MRMMRSAGAVLLLGALLAGCSSIQDHRGYLVDGALVQSIQAGVDNQTSVERTLGRPTFVGQFGQPVWYYVSVNTRQAAFNTPRTHEQYVLRVQFDAQGNVAALSTSGMERVVRLNPNGDKTPTLGRERTFLEDLFGNIGTVGAPGGQPGAGGGQGRP